MSTAVLKVQADWWEIMSAAISAIVIPLVQSAVITILVILAVWWDTTVAVASAIVIQRVRSTVL